MKKIIFVSLVVGAMTAAEAFACPNLSGTFFCAQDATGPAGTVTIAQKQVNGNWVFGFQNVDAAGHSTTAGEVIADGVTRNYVDPVSGQATPESFSCEGDTSLKFDSESDDPQMGHMSLIGHYSINSDGNMALAADMVMGQSTIHFDRVCFKR